MPGEDEALRLFVTISGQMLSTSTEVLKMLLRAVIERRSYQPKPGIMHTTGKSVAQAAKAGKNLVANQLKGAGEYGEVRSAKQLGDGPTAIAELTGSLTPDQLSKLNKLAVAARVKYQTISRSLPDKTNGVSIQYPVKDEAAISALIQTVLADSVKITEAGRLVNASAEDVQAILGDNVTEVTDKINANALKNVAEQSGIDLRIWQVEGKNGSYIQFEFAGPNEQAFDGFAKNAIDNKLITEAEIKDAITNIQDRPDHFQASGITWNRLNNCPSTILDGKGTAPIITTEIKGAKNQTIVASSDANGLWELRDKANGKIIQAPNGKLLSGAVANSTNPADDAWRCAHRCADSIKNSDKALTLPESLTMNSKKLANKAKKAVTDTKKKHAHMRKPTAPKRNLSRKH